MMDWDKAESTFGTALVAAMRERLDSGTSPQVEMQPLVDAGHEAAAVEGLFGMLVASGVMTTVIASACAHCGHPLLPQDVSNGVCPNCQTDFEETGEAPILATTYQYAGNLSRETPWLIAIHGFNTHGEWQEEFSWLVATRFRHRAPVLIFKFPLLRYGVLFGWRHRQLAADLRAKLETAIERANAHGISAPPDIVAHSFGSLLFSVLLDQPAAKHLRFGRVILAGAIVRPDYDWRHHIENGRIEAVLCHCGAKDSVVDWAQFFIPNSGPSGRVGFVDAGALNISDPTFSHGSAFEPATMEATLRNGGLWDLFLKLPKGSSLSAVKATPRPATWRPASEILTVPARWLAITLPVFAAVALLMATIITCVRIS